MWEILEVHTRFWWGDLREIDQLKEAGEDVKIILKLIFKNRCVVVNAVMNLQMPLNSDNFSTS